MIKIILTLIVLLSTAATTFAEDKADRDRRVRVAIALSGKSKPQSVSPINPLVAPFPREIIPQQKLPYFDGYAKASVDSLPLVIFVACDREYKTKDAILSKVESFGSYTKPTILIGYPQGNRLYIDKELTNVISDADLEKAIRAAGKKMVENPVKQMEAAPQPLNWQITNYPTYQQCNLKRG